MWGVLGALTPIPRVWRQRMLHISPHDVGMLGHAGDGFTARVPLTYRHPVSMLHRLILFLDGTHNVIRIWRDTFVFVLI